MTSVKTLASEVVQRFSLETIRDVIDVLPRSMCHILQESRVFGTYAPNMVRLMFPEAEWGRQDAHYRRIADDVIPKITVKDHLANLLAARPERMPCFCRQMADVAAEVVSQIVLDEVYVIRNIYVNYLHLPERWHCINAVPCDGRVRFFDVSAYVQVIDPRTKRILRPHRLAGFDASDLDPSFVVGEGWLQSWPFQRHLMVRDGRLTDTFHPSPILDLPEDEFFSVVRPGHTSAPDASVEAVSWAM